MILSNGGYAIMDRLAERRGLPAPWPGFAEVDVSQLAPASAAPRAASRLTTS